MTNLNYKAESLTAGVTYKFRIQARNSFGNSDNVDALSLLCASKPEAPSAPSTSVSDDKVII